MNRIESFFANKWNVAYLFAGIFSVLAAVKGWTQPLYNLVRTAIAGVLEETVMPLHTTHPQAALFFAVILAVVLMIGTAAAYLLPMLIVWVAEKITALLAYHRQRSEGRSNSIDYLLTQEQIAKLDYERVPRKERS